MKLCLGVPGVVVEVKGDIAIVDFGGIKREVDALLVPDVKPGDYVIVHAGAIIERIDKETFEEMVKYLQELAKYQVKVKV